MSGRPRLTVVGYPTRLVADHAALIEAAEAAGFAAELVAPGRVGVMVDHEGERVLIDGTPTTPDVVLPRGVNRPWPFVREALDVWQRLGARVAPSLAACDLCADKLTLTRTIAAAGVPVLPSLTVAPDAGVRVTPLRDSAPLIAKPARASKGLGLERFESIDDAERALGATRPLEAGMVDHHVVQPLATDWGIDYRVVAAADRGPLRVVAVTERRAPAGEVLTNAAGATVTDIERPERTHADVMEVALAAAHVLGLSFGGIDVIRHRGRAVVLEVNAWPGLAADVRGRHLADALIATVTHQLG